MSNIEDDVNILGAFCLAGIIEIISPEEFEEVKKSIKNILSERKQDKERIKELESKLEEANKQLDLDYVDENYIPKQKAKEMQAKIKELEAKLEFLKKQIDI